MWWAKDAESSEWLLKSLRVVTRVGMERRLGDTALRQEEKGKFAEWQCSCQLSGDIEKTVMGLELGEKSGCIYKFRHCWHQESRKRHETIHEKLQIEQKKS